MVACVEGRATADAVIAAAQHFAERLRGKQLMLMNVSKDGDGEWLNDYGIPYVAMKGDWSVAIEGLPTAFNAVLAVTAVDRQAPKSSITNPRTLLRKFRNCKVAYLVVNTSHVSSPQRQVETFHETSPQLWKKTALTVDFHRESKEKLIWASYLARFLGAELTIATLQYRDEGLRRLLNNNLQFTEKVFTPLGINYKVIKISGSRKNHTNPDLQLLDEMEPDLLVALTTDPRATDPLDWLFGTPDRKILSHHTHTPLLLLNPRDDLYVLCD